MKQTRILKTLAAGMLCGAALGKTLAQIQDRVQDRAHLMSPPRPQTTTTKPAAGTVAMATSTGTIAQYTPSSDHFMFRPSPKAAPVRYYQTTDTLIVDAQGHTTDQSQLRAGVGATVYFTTSGDRMVVGKIIIRQATAAPEKKATKTTTKK